MLKKRKLSNYDEDLILEKKKNTKEYDFEYRNRKTRR